MRQTERWLTAAQQDAHPAIKMLHANYGVANADILKQAFTEAEIKQHTGKDVNELYRTAIRLQDQATRELSFLCPQAVPHY